MTVEQVQAEIAQADQIKKDAARKVRELRRLELELLREAHANA